MTHYYQSITDFKYRKSHQRLAAAHECEFKFCHSPNETKVNLSDDSMEDVDEDVVEHGRWCGIEADLEQVIVVWRDAEARHKTVHHEVDILTAAVLTARERLRCVEQQGLPGTHTHTRTNISRPSWILSGTILVSQGSAPNSTSILVSAHLYKSWTHLLN